jgi:AcrR family transcriptional regulator
MKTTPARLPGRPPDTALQERRREDILATAASSFAEHGYHRTDVQWIADGLGVSKGTIYRYFPTKEELFLAAVRRGVQRLYDALDAATATIADPLERLCANVTSYLEFFRTNPQLVELFVQERAAFKDHRRPVFFELRAARRERWRPVIEDLVRGGRVREMAADRILEILGDSLYGVMFTNYFGARERPSRDQAEELLDVMFNGILTDAERRRRNGAPVR